jgi:hypothetical protein
MCNPATGPYRPGDCAVTLAGTSVPVVIAPNLTSLVKYAATLSAVVADKTCASLQTDAASLATAIGGVATAAKDTSFAAGAPPVTTIVSSIGCAIVRHEQLNVLKEATREANPLVQRLIVLVNDLDTNLQHIAIDAAATQLRLVYENYLRGRVPPASRGSPSRQVWRGGAQPASKTPPRVRGPDQFAVMPPSITSSLPVTHDDSSEAR